MEVVNLGLRSCTTHHNMISVALLQMVLLFCLDQNRV